MGGTKKGREVYAWAVLFMHLLVCQCFQQFDESYFITQVILQYLHFVRCAFQLLIHPVGDLDAIVILHGC